MSQSHIHNSNGWQTDLRQHIHGTQGSVQELTHNRFQFAKKKAPAVRFFLRHFATKNFQFPAVIMHKLLWWHGAEKETPRWVRESPCITARLVSSQPFTSHQAPVKINFCTSQFSGGKWACVWRKNSAGDPKCCQWKACLHMYIYTWNNTHKDLHTMAFPYTLLVEMAMLHTAL